MELYGERRNIGVIHTLAGTVVAVGVAHSRVGRQAVGDNRVAVVLGGDVHLAGGRVLDRLVCAAVTVFELFGLRASGEGEQLMTEADTEHRHAAVGELFELLNHGGILRRVSGAVGKHNAVGIERQHLLGGGVRRHNRQIAAALVELSADIVLRAKVHEHHVPLGIFLRREELVFGDGRALDRLGDAVASELLQQRVRYLGRVLNPARHDACLTHDTGEGARVDTADTGDIFFF